MVLSHFIDHLRLLCLAIIFQIKIMRWNKTTIPSSQLSHSFCTNYTFHWVGIFGVFLSLGILICLGVVLIETLDLNKWKNLSWSVEKVSTFWKWHFNMSRLVSTVVSTVSITLNSQFLLRSRLRLSISTFEKACLNTLKEGGFNR